MHSNKNLIIVLNSHPNIQSEINDLKLDALSTEIQFKNKQDIFTNDFKSSTPINFEEYYKQSYDEAFQKTIDFGEKKLSNNTSIAEQLKDSSGHSLWYHFRFMVFYEFRKDWNEQMIYNRLNELEQQYSAIYVFHSSSYLQSQFDRQKIIKAIFSPQEIERSKKIKIKNIVTFALIFVFRFALGLIKFPLLLKKKHIFLSSVNIEQPLLSMNDLSVKIGDHYSDYYQNFIESKKDTVNLSEFYPPKLTSGVSLQFKKQYLFAQYSNSVNFETVLLLQFLNPLFYVRTARSLKKVKNQFRFLNSNQFDQLSDQLILGKIKRFERLSLYIQIRKAAIKWLFNVFSIKTIGGTHEHDGKNKSILEQAQNQGVMTFGIQHGVIHFKHLHYCFSTFDASFKPFPEATFVWGDYWKKGLTSFSNYNNNSIYSVGQIRTDIIPKLKSNKEKLYVEQLRHDKTTILYPSQPLYIGEEKMRERLAKDFLQLTIEFPNIQFIVKPHPKEEDCETFFEHLSKEMGTSNFVVIRQDLYKLLAFSDIVMIYNSTVGAEAVYFQKPLLVMNYSENDFSGFVKDGVAQEVRNYNELKEAIKQIDLTNFSNSNQENFVADRAFKIDGKVSERIYKKLTSLE